MSVDRKNKPQFSLESHYDKREILLNIKNYLNEGKNQNEITEALYNQYPLLKKAEGKDGAAFRIGYLILEAKQIIFREIELNIEDVMVKHSARYEAIYKKNRMPIDRKNGGRQITDKNILIGHYLTAMDALKRKEKVLGIVGNRMDLQLKQETTIDDIIEEDIVKPKDLNLSKLTIEEKKEMLMLLKKAKGEYEEDTKVTTKVTVTTNIQEEGEEPKYDENVVGQFEVEDVTFEEVKEPEGKGALQVADTIREMNKKEAVELDKKILKQKLKEKLKKIKK